MGSRDATCRVLDIDHVVFWVGNAKATANYYVTRLGFQPLAVREPSTTDPTLAYAVKLNQIVLVLESPSAGGGEVSEQVSRHGDFVKDIALGVQDLASAVQVARDSGADIVRDVREQEDEGGVVRSAVLRTYGDITHTLVDRSRYSGVFLPGFKTLESDVLNELLPTPGLLYIDHVESNMAGGTLEESISWYEKTLQMHRFWCIDYERQLTPYSCIRSLSVANGDETVLMRALKTRGAEIVEWPSTYYDIVRENLRSSPVKVEEDIAELQEMNVLIDHDSDGYMLQSFTKHTQPRATVFLELIQRSHNFKGYGAGNYKTVFEALERLEAAKTGPESK